MFSKVLLMGVFALLPLTSFAAPTMHPASNSCSAPEDIEFFCPMEGMPPMGPYYDAGCSISCADGQTATCTVATCDDSQDGNEVASSCTCAATNGN